MFKHYMEKLSVKHGLKQIPKRDLKRLAKYLSNSKNPILMHGDIISKCGKFG